MRKKFALVAVFAAGIAAPMTLPAASASPLQDAKACSTTAPGYVQANLSWGVQCLHAGEFCKVGNIEYHAYGFDCPAGRLTYWSGGGAATTATTPSPPPTTATTTTTTRVTTTTAVTPPVTTPTATTHTTIAPACGRGYVSANLPWGHKCLHAGQYCKVGNRAYLRFGFYCPATRHLRRR
jgi:hypothetical protein